MMNEGDLKEHVGCKIEINQEKETMKTTQPVLIKSLEDKFKIKKKGAWNTPAALEQVLHLGEMEEMLIPDECQDQC